MYRISVFLILVTMTLEVVSQERFAVKENETLMDGYDPVSYFEGNPSKGKIEYKAKFEGRYILFSSESNRNQFMASPEKYMPAYGGWCSISMTNDNFVIPDYTMYKIQDGSLLFFSVKAFFNGKTAWEKKPVVNKIMADKYYSAHFNN